MAIAQFANSYDSSKRMTSRYTNLLRTSSGAMKTFAQLAGRTTYSDQHYHEYIIDQNGNGIAKEACVPAHPNVCHTHQIIAGIVQSGQSTSIDPSVGWPPHIHALPQASTTTATTTATTTGGGGGTAGY